MFRDYENFGAFVEEMVLPLQQANPGWQRLDGRINRGNPITVARFRHQGEVWRVHSDTRFEPILIAYSAVQSGEETDPFVEEVARKRRCLNLKPSLRHLKTSKFKHLYFYAETRAK